jgi:hypothetical protein
MKWIFKSSQNQSGALAYHVSFWSHESGPPHWNRYRSVASC